jgi:hypothetical protein
MAMSSKQNASMDGHLSLGAAQIGQFVALVRGTRYRLAMLNQGSRRV